MGKSSKARMKKGISKSTVNKGKRAYYNLKALGCGVCIHRLRDAVHCVWHFRFTLKLTHSKQPFIFNIFWAHSSRVLIANLLHHSYNGDGENFVALFKSHPNQKKTLGLQNQAGFAPADNIYSSKNRIQSKSIHYTDFRYYSPHNTDFWTGFKTIPKIGTYTQTIPIIGSV